MPSPEPTQREELEEIERRAGRLDAVAAAELVDRGRGQPREGPLRAERGDRRRRRRHRPRDRRRGSRCGRGGCRSTIPWTLIATSTESSAAREPVRTRPPKIVRNATAGGPTASSRSSARPPSTPAHHRPAHRPPEPGERHRERDLEEERQVVRVDEAAAQARPDVDERHAPERVRARDPLRDADDHLHGRREEERAAERAPHPARRADPGGGEEAGRRKEPVERRGAARRRGEREGDPAAAGGSLPSPLPRPLRLPARRARSPAA